MRAVTIAAIHGHCVGGGVLLATACDLRVAAVGTRFAIPEVDLGIPLTWGGIPRLVREIGPSMTRELVLTCRAFDAAEAHEIGLINRVVRGDQLSIVVDDLAQSLATKSALALEATLTAVEAAAEALVPTGGATADADLFLAAISDPESQAVAAAYLERRAQRGVEDETS
jgi:enoyl-CoA hydratase/carnithine racemase